MVFYALATIIFITKNTGEAENIVEHRRAHTNSHTPYAQMFTNMLYGWMADCQIAFDSTF